MVKLKIPVNDILSRVYNHPPGRHFNIFRRGESQLYYRPTEIYRLRFRVRSIMRAFYAPAIRAIDKTTTPSRIYGIPSARATARSFREHSDCRYFSRFTPRNGSISFDLDEMNTLTKSFPSSNIREQILKHRRYYSLPFSREHGEILKCFKRDLRVVRVGFPSNSSLF